MKLICVLPRFTRIVRLLVGIIIIIITLPIIYLMPAGEYIGFTLATLLYRAR